MTNPCTAQRTKRLANLNRLAILAILPLGCIGPQDSARLSGKTSQASPAELNVNVIEIAFSDEVYDTHTCFGTVKPKRSSYLTFSRGGRVAEIFKEVGQRVDADEVLATLEQQELLDQQTTISEALASAEQQLGRLNPNNRSSNVQREISRLRQEIETLNQRQQEIDREIASRTLVAPYSGIIAERKVDVGSRIPSGSPVFKIVADEAPIIELNIASQIAEPLEPGQELTVQNQDRTIKAIVSSKSPELSPTSHTRLVTLEVASPDPNATWVYGSTVEAHILTNSSETGFWLPISALQREASGLWSALVVEQDGKRQLVTRHLLELLLLDDEHALVQGSLKDGDLVIVNGTNRVVPGQHVSTNTLAYSYQQPGPRAD